MKAQVNNFGTPGVVADLPDLLLTEGAWTNSRNVCYRDGAAEKCRGYAQVFGNLSSTAIWAQPTADGVNTFYVYGNETVLYATDGTTHANVSHPSLSYNASLDLGWNGGAFHGFIIANDAVNIPQSWVPGLGNKFTSLTAFPAITTKVVRSFKDFLFCFRNTTGGNYDPRELRWSDRAAAGGLPLSWDYTDPTNQAGITTLATTDDIIVDALPLRDSLMIYKQNHTWAAEYIGGLDVFSFREVFEEVGMLTENCGARINKTEHLVLTGNDLVVHDGASARSIIDKRDRRWLFNRINTNRYARSFIVPDYRNREAYICFPESGVDFANLALVWNWAEDSIHVFDLGGSKTFAVPGIIPGASTTFDGDTPGSFDAASGIFDEELSSPFAKRLIWFDAAQRKAYQNDTGETYDGIAMTCFAERTGIGVTEDMGQIKRIWQIWPRIKGATKGDILNFYVGVRATEQDDTEWTGPYPFTIGTDNWIDTRVDGRILDLRVEYAGANTFRLYGLGIDYVRTGAR